MKTYTYLQKINKGFIPTNLYPDMVEDRAVAWVYAFDPSKKEESNENIGKWMLFIPPKYIRECWDKIITGVKSGNLFKVKTLPKCRMDKGIYATMIYTENYNDQEDVKRVLRYLSDVGLKGKRTIYYKTDEQTQAGVYRGGEERPWIYSSDDFQR